MNKNQSPTIRNRVPKTRRVTAGLAAAALSVVALPVESHAAVVAGDHSLVSLINNWVTIAVNRGTDPITRVGVLGSDTSDEARAFCQVTEIRDDLTQSVEHLVYVGYAGNAANSSLRPDGVLLDMTATGMQVQLDHGEGANETPINASSHPQLTVPENLTPLAGLAALADVSQVMSARCEPAAALVMMNAIRLSVGKDPISA